MLRKTISVVCGAVLVCAGCGYKKASRAQRKIEMESTGLSASEPAETNRLQMSYVTSAPPRSSAFTFGYLGGTVQAASRFVAVRHKIEIVEAGAGLAKSVDGVVAYCGSIECEVLSSNISGTAPDATPAGNAALRVVPQDLNKLLEFIAKQGKVSQHATETEDKTAEVVDVEAKLKNQAEFRDSLRKMLAKPGVNVADLLQIQEKLAEAQATLDSEAMQRKVLANETEKVLVNAEFHAEGNGKTPSLFMPIGAALKESGGVLGESLAALITAVAVVIPWLIILVPCGWLILRAAKRWKERRRKRRESNGNGSERGHSEQG
jgi:uncharacterized protein DUF4349